MIHDHYLAVLALIPKSTSYGVHFVKVRPEVIDGVEQPLKFPYVVLWGDLGVEDSESLDDHVDKLELRPRATYVGDSAEQCLWLASEIRPALNRARPVVSGWNPSRLKQETLQPMDTDTSTKVTSGNRSFYPVFAVDEFPLTSYPI